MEEGYFGDVVYVRLEAEFGVHVDAEVSDQGGGSGSSFCHSFVFHVSSGLR